MKIHKNGWKRYCSDECRKIGSVNNRLATRQKIIETDPNYLNDIRQKTEQTNLKKFGVVNPMQSSEIKEKAKQTLIEKYGVDNAQKSQEIREKTRYTCIEKYGYSSPASSPEIKEKQKQIFMNNYGVSSPLKHPDILDKMKNTNLERYGVEWSCQNEVVREMQRQTCFNNYGVDNPLASIVIQEKIKETNLKHYGVDNPTKNPEIFQKSLVSGKRCKEFLMPSGSIIKCRGYEPFALSLLLDTYDESMICCDLKMMPKITYVLNQKSKIYYPDIYIPNEKLIIEVKSMYTYNADLEINLMKKHATEQLGLNFRFMIFDDKGNLC